MSLQNVKCDFCIYKIEKEYSKSQFNMVWARIQDIANILRVSKWIVYNQCLKDYGQSEIFEVNADGLAALQEVYQITEILKQEDQTYQVQAWKGIEWMSSKELSIFTDGVLEEWHSVC